MVAQGGGGVDAEASVQSSCRRRMEESSSSPRMSACSGLWSGHYWYSQQASTLWPLSRPHQACSFSSSWHDLFRSSELGPGCPVGRAVQAVARQGQPGTGRSGRDKSGAVAARRDTCTCPLAPSVGAACNTADSTEEPQDTTVAAEGEIEGHLGTDVSKVGSFEVAFGDKPPGPSLVTRGVKTGPPMFHASVQFAKQVPVS